MWHLSTLFANSMCIYFCNPKGLWSLSWCKIQSSVLSWDTIGGVTKNNFSAVLYMYDSNDTICCTIYKTDNFMIFQQMDTRIAYLKSLWCDISIFQQMLTPIDTPFYKKVCHFELLHGGSEIMFPFTDKMVSLGTTRLQSHKSLQEYFTLCHNFD